MNVNVFILVLVVLTVIGFCVWNVARRTETYRRFYGGFRRRFHRPINYVNLHWYRPVSTWYSRHFPYYRRGLYTSYPRGLYNQKCGYGYGKCNSRSEPCCVNGVCSRVCTKGYCNPKYSVENECIE